MNILCQAQRGSIINWMNLLKIYFEDNKHTNNSTLIYELVENTIGWVPRNVSVKQLDRFLETLQNFTCCQFVEVTFEVVTKMKTVLVFGL